MKTARAKTIWLTGLSGSGKTTTAMALQQQLCSAGYLVYVIDGDNLRAGISSDLSFSDNDRSENVRRAAEIAKILNSLNIIVIAALISPLEVDRQRARTIIGESFFYEVYLSTSLAVCESRDIKGLYARARKGEIPNFTGISSLYEIPVQPDIQIDTATTETSEAVRRVSELFSKSFSML